MGHSHLGYFINQNFVVAATCQCWPRTRIRLRQYFVFLGIVLYLVLGMLHAGIGETHLDNVLTALDVPPICHNALIKMERRFGVALKTTA